MQMEPHLTCPSFSGQTIDFLSTVLWSELLIAFLCLLLVLQSQLAGKMNLSLWTVQGYLISNSIKWKESFDEGVCKCTRKYIAVRPVQNSTCTNRCLNK